MDKLQLIDFLSRQTTKPWHLHCRREQVFIDMSLHYSNKEGLVEIAVFFLLSSLYLLFPVDDVDREKQDEKG